MKIGIGADHRGYKTKEFLKKYLEAKGYKIKTTSERKAMFPVTILILHFLLLQRFQEEK
ncbi:hypothetical protein ES703_12024 [subsurface metagenome]